MTATFSKRHGLAPDVPPITVRNEAPQGLRHFAIEYAKLGANTLRDIICEVLKEVPDSNNWSSGNVWGECRHLMYECAWYKTYDVVEAICSYLRRDYSEAEEYVDYAHSINEYMLEKGIGWKIEDGKVLARAEQDADITITETIKVLEEAEKSTASSELREAYKDLSRRPNPDVTGAIQHALACVECLAKNISGEEQMTLGKIIDARPNLFPGALKKVADGIWGYGSQKGRHLTEGRVPAIEEAFLMVGIAAALSGYLIKKPLE